MPSNVRQALSVVFIQAGVISLAPSRLAVRWRLARRSTGTSRPWLSRSVISHLPYTPSADTSRAMWIVLPGR
jgi:hypothetical protein